jgi:N-acetylmuramoyl-L-alanine amidase
MNILRTPSPNSNERSINIDSVIIHYTDMPTTEEALAWLCNSKSQVSAHYLIDEKGKIYQLVPDEKRAWHAGESFWKGFHNLNDCSIGIELSNPGPTHGYVPFPEPQIESLLKLCEMLRTNWGIPASRILGHSDIAPRRKEDPGHLFPWQILAREGLGLWPKDGTDPIFPENVMVALGEIGYETTSPSHTLLAFQRHFQPHKVDGEANEETRTLLSGLLKSILT